MYKFNEEQIKKLGIWMIEQDKKVAELQKDKDFLYKPYYGAIGGAYSYIFTPNSLGEAIHVRNNITKEEIDLTDISNW